MIVSTQGMAGNQSDVDQGKGLLSIYFSLLKGKPSPFNTLSEVIEYYSTDHELKAKGEPYERYHHTDTLESFGYYARILNNPAKLKKSLQKLANSTTSSKAPSAYSFGKVIANDALKVSLSDVSKKIVTSVKEGATTLIKTAAFGAGSYIAIIGIAALAAFIYKARFNAAILRSLSRK